MLITRLLHFFSHMTLACASLLLTLLSFEGVLRFLPVSQGQNALPVNADNPVLRYEPNRNSIWSSGWNLDRAHVVHTNNFGFVSEVDYDREGPPLLAVIGDSYVEALMVEIGEDVTSLLRAGMNSGAARARCYSFAASGAALSQYLAYAQYARDLFRPQGLVVVVVGNDFDESMLKYRDDPGFHYFNENSTGDLQLSRIDLEIGADRRLIRKSALVEYLVRNLNIRSFGGRLSELTGVSKQASKHYVGNTAAEADLKRINDSKRVVDTFLQELPIRSGLPPKEILLAVDGIRPDLYQQSEIRTVKGSYFAEIRDYLLQRARAGGFETVDMQPIFAEHFKENRQRFEFLNDGHWNALGHKILAEALKESKLVKTLGSGRQEPVAPPYPRQ